MRWTWVAVAAVFALSVLPRLPWIDRPMAEHWEEGTAKVLRVGGHWETEGAVASGFVQCMTFGDPADRFIRNQGRQLDDAGRYYYTTYPPLHPVIPYVTLRAAGLPPSVVGVRVVNVALHALGLAALCALAWRLGRRLPPWPRTACVLATAAAYSFAPLALWFHGNAYTTASAGQPFFAAAVWLAVIVASEERPSAPAVAGLGAVLLGLSLSLWLGALFAVAAAAVAAVVRSRGTVAVAAVSTAAAVLGLAATFAQGAGISGAASYAALLIGKASVRSGGVGGRTPLSLEGWRYVLRWTGEGFWPLLAAAAVLWLLTRRRRGAGAGDPGATALPEARLALAYAAVPVALRELVLFEHASIHDFALLMALVPLSLAIGLAAGGAAGAGALSARSLAVGIAALALAGTAGFWVRNAAPASSPSAIGTAIAATARPGEMVFLGDDDCYIGSVMVHYAGRNIARYGDAARAARLMDLAGVERGRLYILDEAHTRVRADLPLGPDGQVAGPAAF